MVTDNFDALAYLMSKMITLGFTRSSIVNIEQTINGRKTTPLHVATLRKNKEIVDYLLDNGADVTVQDGFGRTALHYSVDTIFKMQQGEESKLFDRDFLERYSTNAKNGNQIEASIVLALVNNGADCGVRDQRKNTVFHVLAKTLGNVERNYQSAPIDDKKFTEIYDVLTSSYFLTPSLIDSIKSKYGVNNWLYIHITAPRFTTGLPGDEEGIKKNELYSKFQKMARKVSLARVEAQEAKDAHNQLLQQHLSLEKQLVELKSQVESFNAEHPTPKSQDGGTPSKMARRYES